MYWLSGMGKAFSSSWIIPYLNSLPKRSAQCFSDLYYNLHWWVKSKSQLQPSYFSGRKSILMPISHITSNGSIPWSCEKHEIICQRTLETVSCRALHSQTSVPSLQLSKPLKTDQQWAFSSSGWELLAPDIPLQLKWLRVFWALGCSFYEHIQNLHCL